MGKKKFTRKNDAVDPPYNAPYLIFVCFAKSSALSIGESIRSTVKKAAKLAVYDDIMISVKNHHIPATIRVDTALIYKKSGIQSGRLKLTREKNQIFTYLGKKSHPCCISDPIANHMQFINVNCVSFLSCGLHDDGVVHSYGVNLASMNSNTDTPRYAVAMYIHTSNDSGDRKEKRFGGCLTGLR